MALSKRLRYEILRRDNHTCRYCGATAPDANLTVDHVIPVTLGGTDDPSNLAAACVDCNAGKSASAPGEPLVADVSADAIRWGQAMKEAAAFLMTEFRDRHDLHDRFLGWWNAWGYGPSRQPIPLPGGWQHSVDAFLAAGLPLEILSECIDRAMSAKHVTPDNTFRYMCGIAWRKITELQEIAKALLEADQGD